MTYKFQIPENIEEVRKFIPFVSHRTADYIATEMRDHDYDLYVKVITQLYEELTDGSIIHTED